MIQQREYQCDEEAVAQRPHRRIGFVPKPERTGGVGHKERDEPEQGLYEEAGESFLGSHKIRGFKVLQRFTVCRKNRLPPEPRPVEYGVGRCQYARYEQGAAQTPAERERGDSVTLVGVKQEKEDECKNILLYAGSDEFASFHRLIPDSVFLQI